MLCNRIIGTGSSKRNFPSEWNYFRGLASENESAFLIASGGIDTIAFTGADDFVLKLYGGEDGTQLLYTIEAEGGKIADLWNCDTANYPLPSGLRLSNLKGKPYTDEKFGDIELFTVVTSKPDGSPVCVAVAETAFSNLGLPYYRILACDLNLPSSPTVRGCVKNALELEFVFIKEGMTEIPVHAFFNSGLRECEIPEFITSIGNAAFYGTPIETMYVPDSVNFLGEYAFSQCKFLKEVHLPEALNTISIALFSGCQALAKVNIPQSVTKVCDTAFYGCRVLKEIVLPETVENFTPYMLFGNCDVLDNFEFYGTNTEHVDATGMFANCHQLRHISMPNVKLKAFGCPGKSASAKNKIGYADTKSNMPIDIDWKNFDDESTMETVWDTSYTCLSEENYLKIFGRFFTYGKYFFDKYFIITGSNGATDVVRDYIINMLGGICVG